MTRDEAAARAQIAANYYKRRWYIIPFLSNGWLPTDNGMQHERAVPFDPQPIPTQRQHGQARRGKGKNSR